MTAGALDVDDIARALEVLRPIDGGYRVAETSTHYLDVMAQFYNWRLCEVPKDDPRFVARFWCYEGRDLQGLLAATAAALAWVASGDDEPVGWRKNGQTLEYGPTRAELAARGADR